MPQTSARLAALVAGGFLNSLWALFQWGELLVARAGGTPFCAIGGSFDCAAVWDSALARTVHDVTNVPVAGWGLMWGIVAFALPLAALVRPDVKGLPGALRLTALAGVLSVGGLAAASLMAGAVCIGCLGTYALVLSWGVLAFLTTKGAALEPQRAVLLAGGVTLASYLALLVPGMRTPHAMDASDTIKKAAAANASAGSNANHNANGSASSSSAPGTPGPFDGPSTGDANKDEALKALLEQLPPDARQAMADLLGAYEGEAPSQSLPEPRTVFGEPNAEVRIVDWTDPLCPHCAELHEVLEEITKVAPGSIRVESHFFPLDGLCNSEVERKNESGEVRCLATKALICLEGDIGKFHLGQKLIFDNQRDLTPDLVWKLIGGLADRKTLEACIASPETQVKLDADIRAAEAHHLDGTPLVLLNGKEVKPFGPILYALALTGGKTRTQAFKSLPAPRPLPKHDHPH